jgi:S1-C subfamily serine protease
MDTGGQGSAFVIAPDMLMTARHCLLGVKEITITTNSGHVFKAHRFIVNKEHDVGYILLDEAPKWVWGEYILKPVRFGSIENMRLGDTVFSIGSTAGMAHFNAVAIGNVQVLDPINLHEYNVPDFRGWESVFSVTNKGGGGNSGCPLFDEHGKVIGVWVASYQPLVHYCIPTDLFLRELLTVRAMFNLDQYELLNDKELPEPEYHQ